MPAGPGPSLCSKCKSQVLKVGDNPGAALRSCLALTSPPNDTSHPLLQEEVCLDPRERWRGCRGEEGICGFSMACKDQLMEENEVIQRKAILFRT